MTATLSKWYEDKGRHEIFAGGKKVGLQTAEHSMILRDEDVYRHRQTDLDDKGIAKTAREEKTRKRDESLKQKLEDAKMEKLYREHVLGEKPIQDGFIPLGTLLATVPTPKVEEEREEVGSFGD